MAIKDILLALTTYPDPAPDSSIDHALALASELNAQVTGLALEADLKLSHHTNFLTRMLIDVPAMAKEETAKSRAHAAHLKAYFQASATRQRVRHDVVVERCEAFRIAESLVEEAKVRDLTVVPLQNVPGVEQWHAESIVFGSGRPVLLLPGPARVKQAPSLAGITVAWDFSRPAARALADALPLMRQAGRARIVTIENEKALDSRRPPDRLLQHLTAHGIDAKYEVIDAAGRSAGQALRDHLQGTGATMLVMGAFGHSRVREFVLGGTTQSMLDDPPLPVLLSH